MWWLFLGAGAVLLIKKLVDEWAWERNCEYEDIERLPGKPGIYIMYRKNRIIHVGSTGNLYERLSKHPKKHRMTSFDWYQTRSITTAKRLEKELQRKVGYSGR